MPHFESTAVMYLWTALAVVAAIALLFFGYKVGTWVEGRAGKRLMEQKEQELFTAQRGFRQVFENEVEKMKRENVELSEQAARLEGKVEEYRKKAAGFGGLFSQGGKRADAMYALLLENEALEEALMSQNEKLRQERSDAVKEQIRSTGYRRVLISQLLNDERIKGYVAEVLADEKKLPAPAGPPQQALPEEGDHRSNGE